MDDSNMNIKKYSYLRNFSRTKKMSKYIIKNKLNIDKISEYFHKQAKKYKKVKFGRVDYNIKRNNFLNKHKSLLDESKIEVITIIADRE